MEAGARALWAVTTRITPSIPFSYKSNFVLFMSVGLFVTLCFLAFTGIFPHHCSCPSALLAFYITAPAHPHVIWVAAYPALFFTGTHFYN